MKKLLLFGVLALSINAFGQSKKEQIVALNYSIDSLNTVLSTARDKSSKDIQGLNYEIAQLKNDVSSLESSTTKLTKENEKLKLDMEKMSKKNLELEAELKAMAGRAIEINPFVGSWYDDDNCWISITEHKENLNISYYAGPCQGDIKGIFIKDKYELIHEDSQCNYRGFNNDHILGKKIGYATLTNGQLVLDLTIVDDLLKKGGQVFNRTEW